MNIVLNRPIEPNIKNYVKYVEQINSRAWYTNFGPLYEELTTRLEEFLGVKNLLLVANGTMALDVAYKVLGAKSAATTPFTFAATTTSLLWRGCDLYFSDIDKITFNLCPNILETNLSGSYDIDSIVATHVYGNPCDVVELEKLAKNTQRNLIYDAAHAFGVNVAGESILSFGDASTLSFHATKIFHTVEGGAIVFKDNEAYKKAKRAINFGLDDSANVTGIGINAKLSEYHCAVGLTLLNNIQEIITHRSELFHLYLDTLSGVVEFPKWHPETNNNGAYMPILLSDSVAVDRVMSSLLSEGIQSRRYFSPSLDQVFKGKQMSVCQNSLEISERVLCLPLHYYLSKKDVLSVVSAVKRSLK